MKNYLIIFECVDKLSRKNYIWVKYWIWSWRYLDYEFGFHYILLELDLKSFGQQFVITLITVFRYFTGVRLENTWTTNLDYNYHILWDLDLKLMNYKFGFWLLCISLDLDLKILEVQIWIRIIRFYRIWTWKYLHCDLELQLI